jgi:hypothetical protein
VTLIILGVLFNSESEDTASGEVMNEEKDIFIRGIMREK